MTPNPTTPGNAIAHEHIVLTPGTCGGRARIDGTRIRVQDVMIWHERLGRSAEQIVRDFPQLTLGQVYAALAYYYDHRTEVDGQLLEDEQTVAAMKQQFPSLLTKLSSEAAQA
jgi:uncharacterized protein (DUF433 family)